MKKIITPLGALALSLLLLAPAAAQDNTGYGETRFNKLPLSGMVSKNLWVGSWWSYAQDGIAYRLHDSSVSASGYATNWNRWDSKEVADLSPAEKFDLLVGRFDKIEYEALIERGKRIAERQGDMQSMIDERRRLVTTLNRMIAENRSTPGFRWWETEEGERYQELQKEIEEAEEAVSAVELTVDTAFEYEVLNHGSLQFGVEYWFGHCNAWAAAAITEPEPRRAVEVDGILFTPGDVKALVTENWMEIQSHFWGTRNNADETEEDRADISYQDMTPAGFHILTLHEVGNRDRSFVFDVHTGKEVWNHPVKAYRSRCEPLYEDDIAMEREVTFTRYTHQGPTLDERGAQEVFPVLCTTTFHYMNDGVPHEMLTRLDITDDIDDETFRSSSRIHQLYDNQVLVRTLVYELWLDRPKTHDDARIIGDGVWQHGAAMGYSARHPDFAWQPTTNINSPTRDYENEFIDYRIVSERILPGTLEGADDPDVQPEVWSVEGPVDIPDADPVGASLDLEVTADVTIERLEVDVEITHTYIGDLQVRLIHPSGKADILKRFSAGGSAHDIRETYDVKAFNGLNARGTWTLEVIDQWRRDVGTIDSFALRIK